MRSIEKAAGLGLSLALLAGACGGDNNHQEPQEAQTTQSTQVDQDALREANEAYDAAQAALDEANERWHAFEQSIGEQCTRLLYPYLPEEPLDDASDALIVEQVREVSTDEHCNTGQEITLAFRGLEDHFNEAHFRFEELREAEANIAIIEAGGTIPEEPEE